MHSLCWCEWSLWLNRSYTKEALNTSGTVIDTNQTQASENKNWYDFLVHRDDRPEKTIHQCTKFQTSLCCKLETLFVKYIILENVIVTLLPVRLAFAPTLKSKTLTELMTYERQSWHGSNNLLSVREGQTHVLHILQNFYWTNFLGFRRHLSFG